jgi:hypothetical protein
MRLELRVVLLMVTAVPMMAAQSPVDTSKHGPGGVTRAWLSLGLGGGSSRRGGIAGRAAASIAVSPLIVFTVETTSVGSIDGADESLNLMAGVQSPDRDGFVFLSAGLAHTSCGSGCPNQTGIALDGGFHIGRKYAGVCLCGFAIHAPQGSSSSGVVVAVDLGWFGREGGRSSVSQ